MLNNNIEEKTKLQQMREAYNNLYYKSDKVDNVQPKELSEQEKNLTEQKIEDIKRKIEKIKHAGYMEKREIFQDVIKELNIIRDYPMTIEQAEKLNSLFKDYKIDTTTKGKTTVRYYINCCKQIVTMKLISIIHSEQMQIQDIEELNELKSKLEANITDNSLLSSEKRIINNKINKIRQQQVLENLKNNVPENIAKVARDLANGTLKLKEAKQIIKREAKEKVKNKPKTKFSLTAEQEEKQILMQIQHLLIEKPEDYEVKNYKKATRQLQNLCEGDLGQAVFTVVRNMIGNKHFDDAKNICNNCQENKEMNISTNISLLRKEIRNEEISDLILRAIKTKRIPEQEEKCFKTIERRLKNGDIKLETINLGKSKDNLTKITLADVWPDEIQR